MEKKQISTLLARAEQAGGKGLKAQVISRILGDSADYMDCQRFIDQAILVDGSRKPENMRKTPSRQRMTSFDGIDDKAFFSAFQGNLAIIDP